MVLKNKDLLEINKDLFDSFLKLHYISIRSKKRWYSRKLYSLLVLTIIYAKIFYRKETMMIEKKEISDNQLLPLYKIIAEKIFYVDKEHKKFQQTWSAFIRNK